MALTADRTVEVLRAAGEPTRLRILALLRREELSVMELAQALLTGQVENPAATYSRAVASGKETWLALKPNLPVHLVYFTTFPDEDGRIRSHPDIYDRDGALWQALVKAGVESGDGDG